MISSIAADRVLAYYDSSVTAAASVGRGKIASATRGSGGRYLASLAAAIINRRASFAPALISVAKSPLPRAIGHEQCLSISTFKVTNFLGANLLKITARRAKKCAKLWPRGVYLRAQTLGLITRSPLTK